MRYTLFPWDCSSIGQSTALSRRKLRVRAPSVPTDQINTSIHLYIFFWQKRHTEMNSISAIQPSPQVFFSFLVISHQRQTNISIVITSTSTDWWGERQNCSSLIVGNIIFWNIIFRIPRDSVLRLVLKFIASI